MKLRWVGISFVVLMCFGLMSAHVFCDDHGDDYGKHSKGYKDRHHSKADKGQNNKRLSVVQNQTYLKTCGSCHFAYQPGLLTAASWEKIMTAGHFGVIDTVLAGEITDYLKANSADKSTGKISRKILASLNGAVPEAITKVPYIQKKHRKIDSEVFKRPSIVSKAHCKACHQKADQGVYEDDDVIIPSR